MVSADNVRDVHQMEVLLTLAVQSIAFPATYTGMRSRYIHVVNNTAGKIAFTVNNIDPVIAKVNVTWELNFVVDAGDEWAGNLSFGTNPFKIIGQSAGLKAIVEIGQV